MSAPRPDLILLDIEMPEMDGYEVCGRLKKEAATQGIPVIFITAKGEVKDETKGLELGAVDYITKPFSIPIVNARIRTHLQLLESKRQLEARNKTLRELSGLKDKFVGMASHDLRNPLTSICGFARLLEENDENLSEKDKMAYIRTILSFGEKMLALVNNLLDISIIESENLKLDIRPNSFEELCRERIRIFDIHAKGKNIALHSSYKEIEDVPCDKNQISQALDNLISNAIKFSPHGANVYISLEKNEDMARASVRDEGPGIPEEDKAKLFETFQKLKAKPTGGEKSTGLG